MKKGVRILLKIADIYLYICGVLFIVLLVDLFDYDEYINRREDLGSGYTYWMYNGEIESDDHFPSWTVPRYIDEMEYDSLFVIAMRREPSKEKERDYWIIDKSTREVYREMDLPQFNHRCDSLGIKLRFKEEKN